MTGEYAAARILPPELHEAATRLVAEAMASAAIRAMTEPSSIITLLREADLTAPSTDAFLGWASDFIDIRGDLVAWALPAVKS